MFQPIPESNRTWRYLAIGFVVFWAVYLSFFLPRAPLDNTGLSAPASYDWSLVDLNDKPVPFSRFKGKTVFLNFWATWCGPCVGEMPSIDKLARNPRLQGKNIEFVCASMDDSTEAVQQFVALKGWAMTILRAEDVPPVFHSEGIPATFLIAPDGRIASTLVGAANWSEPHVVEFLEKLADPKPPAGPR